MIVKTKPGFLLLGLSVFTVTPIYGDIRCLSFIWWSSDPCTKFRLHCHFLHLQLNSLDTSHSDLAGTTSVMTTNITTRFRVIEVSAYQVSLYLVACLDSDSALILISFQRQAETQAQAGTWRPGWARCWASCGSPAPRRSNSGPSTWTSRAPPNFPSPLPADASPGARLGAWWPRWMGPSAPTMWVYHHQLCNPSSGDSKENSQNPDKMESNSKNKKRTIKGPWSWP